MSSEILRKAREVVEEIELFVRIEEDARKNDEAVRQRFEAFKDKLQFAKDNQPEYYI